ncbi:hypothetical protein JKP88DRAFT_289286 [Tribonema minus]|uniref:Uncharacterized protein n=1 Tax=Tribonema minus TaxID=303371 RepID=A0A835Z199_9STRA|nr:hypothetical protein JKP88DRAFT_289286 [Tribonema minus]
MSVTPLPSDTNVYVSSLSATRTGPMHNDVEVSLPRPVLATDGYSLKMSILSLSIANTQTCINVYNNTLTISGVTQTITPGNYSAAVLAAALNTAFPTRSVTFNALTSQMTFSSPTTMVISGSLCDPLGITEGTSGLVVSSKNSVDLSGNSVIYVFTSLSCDSVNAAQASKRGLLAVLQNDVPPLGVLHYSDPNGRQGGLIAERGAAASAVLGPEAGLALNGISAAAGFANQVTRAAPSIANGFRTVNGAQRSNKLTAVSAVSSKFSNVPVSGTSFAGGSIVSIDIAGSGQRSCWMDPSSTMLNFTVTVSLSGGTAPTWAAHGYSFIQSLNLYAAAGSTQIESVAQYGTLHAALRDCCTSQDMVRTRDSITLGADPTRLRSPIPNLYSTTTTASYSIPLISVIGTLSNTDRYLPLHALSSPLRLDLELANPSTAIASGGTAAATSASYAITAVSLDCEYITLADDAHRSICALTNNQFAWSSSQWRTYRTVHAAGQTSNAIMIPSRVTSMKSLLIAQREAAAEFDIAKSSVTQRLRNNLKQYQVRSGSQWINAQPVSTAGSALPAYIEVTKVFSNPASESGCGLFASDSWAVDGNVPPTSTSVEGSFLIGVELEAFSQNNKLISGHSTAANSLVAEIAFASAPLACNLDAFCEADAAFLIDGNTKQFTVAA